MPPKGKATPLRHHALNRSAAAAAKAARAGYPAAGSGFGAAGTSQHSQQELEEMQSNEIMALESILASDFHFVDLEAQSPWRKTAVGGAAGSGLKESGGATPSSPSPPAPQQQHAFELVIRPDTDALKALVTVHIQFKLPKRYPLLVPITTVITENARGLDTAQLKALQDRLSARGKELLLEGSDAMIFELYNAAQEYISTHNTELSALDTAPNRSLDEEKQQREQERVLAEVERAQQDEERRVQEEQDRAAKIAQLIQEQADRNMQAMAEEKARKKQAGMGDQARESTPEHGLHRQYESSSTLADSSATSPTHAGVNAGRRRVETFIDELEISGVSTKHIVVGPVLQQRALSRVYAVEALDVPNASCWHMESFDIASRHYNLSSGKRRLEEVEWELDKLRTLRSDSLVNVLGAALISDVMTRGSSSSNVASSSMRKHLNIVTEAAEGTTASQLLAYGIELPWSRVRHYLLDVLSGLEALHARNIVHRDVSIGNIVLREARGEQGRARLSRPGYAQRMLDLNAENPLVDKGAQFPPSRSMPSGWDAPEILTDGEAIKKHHYSRKRDIWDTGIVAIQMLLGKDIVHHYASPTSLLASKEPRLDSLGRHVPILLQSMLEPSTRKRPTASEVRARLEESIVFETDELGAASSTMKATPVSSGERPDTEHGHRKPFARTLSEREDVFRPGSFWQLQRGAQGAPGGARTTSRYSEDFEELKLLGKGAYGAVYKARNRLDGRDYAIKKIRLSSAAENDEKTLREITALSRLSHQNIVRYVTCWIETQEGAADSNTSTSFASETQTSSLNASSLEFRAPGINDDFLSAGHDAFSNGASNIFFGHSDSESDSEDEREKVPKRDRRMLIEDDESSSSSEDEVSGEDSESSSQAEHSRKDGSNKVSLNSRALTDSRTLSNQVRWLYIQMEYVENETLKEAIDEGLSVEEAWRLFRQIVEALAHVASLGIIHRDLKPSNILMYGRNVADPVDVQSRIGSIKIGDFGLATTTPNQANDGAPAFGTAEDTTDQTNDIGTSLYIAPEVLRGGDRRYDGKVDIYACGIVFFEMLASQRIYKTGMERIHVIRELRTPDICFPTGWNEAQLQSQTKLLRRMLSHDPSERPTPLEILRSDLLPPKMEDEYIAECMRLLSMPNSTYNLQLMDSLFDRNDSYEQREARDLTFDSGSNEGGQAGLDNRFVAVAAQHLRRLFRLRGAVEVEAPLLLPPNDLYADEKQRPVELLDKTGKVVQLPFDLVVPFARMIARGQHQRMKRFAIAHVFRPNLLAGGQPRSVDEVDFDIVAPEKTSAAEAEVLGVIDEIIDEIPGLKSDDWVIQISHAAVLDLLMERVPSALKSTTVSAIALLSSGNKSTVAQGRQQLANTGLARSVLDEIENANLSDDVDTVFKKLETLVAYDLQPRLSRAVEEVRDVIKAAQQFGIQRRFQFTPLLIGNMSFYRDAVYFVVVRARGKRRDVLASGGRYDALLKRFANPTLHRSPSHAVGIQIALGRIAVALARNHEASGGVSSMVTHGRAGAEDERIYSPFTPRRCDVYVASAAGLLSVRMEICRELWAANISADLAYEHALEDSPELLASTCRAEGIHFLVIARSRGSMLKIKAVLSRTEHEVHRWELTGWLLDRLQRLRTGTEGFAGVSLANTERPLLQPLTAGPAQASSSGLASMLQASEVEVILPERYAYDKRKADKHGTSDTRRGRKQAYLGPIQENAARQVSKLTEDLSQMMVAPPLATGAGSASAGAASNARLPIVAVDVGSNTTAFHRLCGAALARTDEALWKLFMDSLATPDEREYGRSLRQRISELQGRAWLVSTRAEGAVAMI